MRVLLQRVTQAAVDVEGREIAAIGPGFLLLAGIGNGDTPEDAEWMARKIVQLRVFEDEQGKMNLDIWQAQGAILSVSQFTLYADTTRGNRPGFEAAAKPEQAQALWQRFNQCLRAAGPAVQEGRFGAHMAVRLANDGPVTIWLESPLRPARDAALDG